MDSISLLIPNQQPKVLTQDDFDQRFNFVRQKKRRTNRDVLRVAMARNFQSYQGLTDFLPFLTWIKTYDVKTSALRDFLGSLLLAALLIPQGIANGLLASDVFAGMFSILLPNLIYPFLGSARHCTLGSLSMTSFLIYSSGKNSGSSISTITLWCGAFQLLHFFFPLDFLLHFVSSNLLLGFSAGVATRIALQFIPTIFNFSSDECGQIFSTMCAGSLMNCLKTVDAAAPLLFISTLIILLVFEWKLDRILSQSVGTATPHELLTIFIVAIVCYFIDFPETQMLAASLSRSFVLYTPIIPTIQMLLDSFAIFLFSLSTHTRVASSDDKTRKINKKQESFCFSVISMLSSPIGLLPPASSRENTQMSRETKKFSLISNLLASIWMAPLLYFGRFTVIRMIPKSAVIALIIASISDSWVDLKQLRVLYLLHIWDATLFYVRLVMGKRKPLCRNIVAKLTWLPSPHVLLLAVLIITTLICTFALFSALLIPNLCVAFLLSVGCALFSVILRMQWTKCDVMVRVADNYFGEENRYEGECPDSPFYILRINTPLIFLNCEAVREAIRAQAVAVKRLIAIGIGSRTPSVRSHVLAHRGSITGRSSNLTNIIITQDADIPQVQFSDSIDNTTLPPPEQTLRFIVLDCSGMPYVDPEAVAMLTQIYSELRTDHVKLLLAGVSANVRDFLEINKFFSTIPKGHLFPTLQEALSAVRIMSFPFHMSVSMNGCRDVITLSTAPSNHDFMCRLSPEPV